MDVQKRIKDLMELRGWTDYRLAKEAYYSYGTKGGRHMPEYRTFFEKLARDRNITVEEMRAIISAHIKSGMNDPDPIRRAQWEKIPHTGDMPLLQMWGHFILSYD